MNNLYSELPKELTEEHVDVLADTPRVRIERIVSTGQSSPDDFWYDQPENEWVVVLQGAAELAFEGEAEPVKMHSGDHILIPAGRRHRVVWTSSDEPTVWLAVFY